MAEQLRQGLSGVNAAKELESLPLQKIFSAVLESALDAQFISSLTTIEFIKEVGFKPNPDDPSAVGEARYLTLKGKNEAFFQGTKQVLTVPLLTLFQIPNLRLVQMSVSFNFKITESAFNQQTVVNMMNQSAIGMSTKDTTLDPDSGFEGEKVIMNKFDTVIGQISKQEHTNKGVEVQREYNMQIDMQATETETPAGLEMLLQVFTAALTAAPKPQETLTFISGQPAAGAAGAAAAGAAAV